MGIVTELLSGKKIKFNSNDIDKFVYDEENSLLIQTINGETTNHYLTITEVNEDLIRINWGGNVVTYFELDIIIRIYFYV